MCQNRKREKERTDLCRVATVGGKKQLTVIGWELTEDTVTTYHTQTHQASSSTETSSRVIVGPLTSYHT